MSKKTIIITITKAIAELAGIILLIGLIVYLVKSENGILAKISEGTAQEKLDTAIKTFSSTEGMKLKTALETIDGLDDLQINNETGEYNIKIDGQDFLVVSKEIIPEEEQENNSETIIEVKEKTENNVVFFLSYINVFH